VPNRADQLDLDRLPAHLQRGRVRVRPQRPGSADGQSWFRIVGGLSAAEIMAAG
jgi:hypothetical protein